MSGLLGGRCTPREGRSRAVLTDEGFLSPLTRPPPSAKLRLSSSSPRRRGAFACSSLAPLRLAAPCAPPGGAGATAPLPFPYPFRVRLKRMRGGNAAVRRGAPS